MLKVCALEVCEAPPMTLSTRPCFSSHWLCSLVLTHNHCGVSLFLNFFFQCLQLLTHTFNREFNQVYNSISDCKVSGSSLFQVQSMKTLTFLFDSCLQFGLKSGPANVEWPCHPSSYPTSLPLDGTHRCQVSAAPPSHLPPPVPRCQIQDAILWIRSELG